MGRLPDYLKTKIAPVSDLKNRETKKILNKYGLNTVCDGARCPNKAECYGSLTATFLIMGKNCTRNCRFCNILSAKPENLNPKEPENVANAVVELGLKYVVITSVTRDDLPDFGAVHFKKTINEIRKKDKNIKIEILTPDFKGDENSLNAIIEAKPDIFNHNVETVPSLYKIARKQANYSRSLGVLKYIKEKSGIITKTGIMTGLGETFEELIQTIEDIKNSKVDILTIGQYICPSREHLPVIKYYKPEEFEKLKEIALKIGIKACVSSPLSRSSHRAYETYLEITGQNPDLAE